MAPHAARIATSAGIRRRFLALASDFSGRRAQGQVVNRPLCGIKAREIKAGRVSAKYWYRMNRSSRGATTRGWLN